MDDSFDNWLRDRTPEADIDARQSICNLVAGNVLGSYRIIRKLGRGGMGSVYEAEHIRLGTRRALKVFVTNAECVEFLAKRFLAEGRLLADLNHPRVVRVYDFEVDAETGTPYFAMDLVLSPRASRARWRTNAKTAK